MIGKCAIYFKTSSSTGWMKAGSVTSIELIIWNFWMILRILNGFFTARRQHLLVFIIFKYCDYVLAGWWQWISLGQQTLSYLLCPWEKKLFKFSSAVQLDWWVSCLFSCFPTLKQTLVKKLWFNEDELTVFLLSFIIFQYYLKEILGKMEWW